MACVSQCTILMPLALSCFYLISLPLTDSLPFLASHANERWPVAAKTHVLRRFLLQRPAAAQFGANNIADLSSPGGGRDEATLQRLKMPIVAGGGRNSLLMPSWFPFARRGENGAEQNSLMDSDAALMISSDDDDDRLATSTGRKYQRALQRNELETRLIKRMLKSKQQEENDNCADCFEQPAASSSQVKKRTQLPFSLSSEKYGSSDDEENVDNNNDIQLWFNGGVDEADVPKSRRRTLREIFQ